MPAHHQPDETAGDLSDQLLRLTRRLNHAHRQNFAPEGITPAQGRLLRTLTRDTDPPRMADLAERLGVVPRQVTTLVDGLEEHGLVRRAPDASNRRVTRIELTDGGLRALKGLRQARKAAAEEILAPLSPGQRGVLSELLTLLDTEHATSGKHAGGGQADGGGEGEGERNGRPADGTARRGSIDTHT